MPRSSSRDQPPSNPGLTCFNCQWRERSEWCVLDDKDLETLDRSKHNNGFQTGQIIFNQGDDCTGVYCLVSGTVAMRKTDRNGNSVLVRLRHAGETIGYRDFFSGQVFTTSAEALTPVSLCYIGKDAVGSILKSNPALGLNFLNLISADLQAAEDTLLRVASLSTRTRMAHLLLALKDRYATVQDDGSMILQLPLSRQDIADILGSRPETVARIIHALEVDGVALFSGRKVIIPDLDGLLDEIEPFDG